jgi:hyperosmotically inducible periplasmic protein
MKQLICTSLVLAMVVLGAGSWSWAQSATPTAPNNSGINVRDRDADAVTAGQQSNSKSDIELTRQIRRAVEHDGSLSMQAHNVKIISENGVVTLRGPVKSRHEKVSIGRKAREIAGADNVKNLLQVETR